MLSSRQFWGTILLLLGAFWLVGRIEPIPPHIREFIKNLWPIILIIIGIALMVKHRDKEKTFADVKIDFTNKDILDDSKKISQTFGDMYFDAKDIEIDGVRLSSTFGDITVNLKDVKLKPGDNILTIANTMGEINVMVPSSIEVSVKAASQLGEIAVLGKSKSGIRPLLNVKTDGYDRAPARLQINAGTELGEIRIHRV